jgi:GTP pyrophosphokinase
MNPSPKFELALQYAAVIHAGQKRRGSSAPLLAHLLSVASLLMEHAASEDEVIAGLLHEAVEQAGGLARLVDIRQRFGEAVAEIVAGCSEPPDAAQQPWRARKVAGIARVPQTPESTRRVATAAKLDNARAILRGLLSSGDAVWDRVEGGKAGLLWHYRCLVQAYRNAGANPLVAEFERVVADLERAVKAREAEAAAKASGTEPAEAA